MPPQPPSRSRAIPLLLLCLGYLSILTFGATYAINSFPGSIIAAPPVARLLPLIGLALVFGYSQARSGKQPWGAPRTFWIVSSLFNVGTFFLVTLNSSPESLSGTPHLILSVGEKVFFPTFDPGMALFYLSTLTGVSVITMPLVAILSAIEATRAFREAKTSLPENRIPPWSQHSA